MVRDDDGGVMTADGCADVIIGAPHDNSGGGVYIVLGNRNIRPAALDLATTDINTHYRIVGDAKYTAGGFAVQAGDVNGDGRYVVAYRGSD